MMKGMFWRSCLYDTIFWGGIIIVFSVFLYGAALVEDYIDEYELFTTNNPNNYSVRVKIKNDGELFFIYQVKNFGEVNNRFFVLTPDNVFIFAPNRKVTIINSRYDAAPNQFNKRRTSGDGWEIWSLQNKDNKYLIQYRATLTEKEKEEIQQMEPMKYIQIEYGTIVMKPWIYSIKSFFGKFFR